MSFLVFNGGQDESYNSCQRERRGLNHTILLLSSKLTTSCTMSVSVTAMPGDFYIAAFSLFFVGH